MPPRHLHLGLSRCREPLQSCPPGPITHVMIRTATFVQHFLNEVDDLSRCSRVPKSNLQQDLAAVSNALSTASERRMK